MLTDFGVLRLTRARVVPPPSVSITNSFSKFLGATTCYTSLKPPPFVALTSKKRPQKTWNSGALEGFGSFDSDWGDTRYMRQHSASHATETMLVLSGPFELWAVWQLKRRMHYKTATRVWSGRKGLGKGKLVAWFVWALLCFINLAPHDLAAFS